MSPRAISLLVVLGGAVTGSAGDSGRAPTSSARGASRRGGRGAANLPRPAFQLTEPVFELNPEEYASGKPYLIQFRGKGDDYCAQMEPLKEQLKEELGINIRCFEVWYNPKNLELLQRLDRGRCGGVPFFYNKRSRRACSALDPARDLSLPSLPSPPQPRTARRRAPPPTRTAEQTCWPWRGARNAGFICGATTYANLRAWAICEPCEPFLPPPNINDDKEEEPNKVQRLIGKVKQLAEEKMAQQRGDAPSGSD